MSNLRYFVFVSLMLSSFYANAISYNVNLAVSQQDINYGISPFGTAGGGEYIDGSLVGSLYTPAVNSSGRIDINDNWTLNVASGQQVVVDFTAVNVPFFNFSVDGFSVTNTGAGFVSAVLGMGTYVFGVTGTTGTSGGGYSVKTIVDGLSGPGAVVPLPAAAWLMGSGLMGLIAFSRRKDVNV